MELTIAVREAVEKLGYERMKEKQLEAISSFVEGKDTFVSLPTGYGKSLIYAALPLVFDKVKGSPGSIVVCMSPLTTLMIDQCTKFSSRGLVTGFVGEGQMDRSVIRKVIEGKVQLVYMTPESAINNPKYHSMLHSPVYRENLVALVVDEAHCVKLWGDQFRRTFSRIGDLRSLLPTGVNVMALTATATMETYQAVVQRLSMEDPALVSLAPERGNIMYLVHSKATLDELSDILCTEFCKNKEFPKTVIFVRKYRDCSDLYLTLQNKLGQNFTSPPGYPNSSQFRRVEMFNRVLTSEKKESVFSTFLKPNSKLRLVVATTAFGLGVDIPDIERVIHWGLPSDVEEYVQEAGRAGRNGEPAQAILYQGKGGKYCNKKIRHYATNTIVCRRRFLFNGFLSFFEKDIEVAGCRCCDICKLKCNCELCN